jgi:uncharacterized membrane protein
VTPPLNPFFVHLAKQAFLEKDFAVRLPSFVFGTLNIPILFIFASKLFGNRVGIISSLLLAMSPLHIWYSQDARMYALMWMLELLSLIFFLKSIERPSLENYFFYTIATTCALYTHQYSVFILLMQWIFLLLYRNKFDISLTRWIVLSFIIILLYSPWLIYSMTILRHLAKAGFVKPVDIKALFYTFYTYGAGFSIGPSLRELHINTSLSVIRPYLYEIIPLFIPYIAIFLSGLLSLAKEGQKFVFVLLLIIIPIGGAFFITFIMPDLPYNVRYTGVALFGFIMILAYGVNQMSKLRTYGILLTAFSLSALIVFNVYAYVNYNFDKRYQKEDIRGTVAYLKENRKEDDIQLCAGNPGGIFGEYSERKFLCITLPIFKKQDDIISFFNKEVRDKKRLWLIVIHDWPEETRKSLFLIKNWLDRNYREIKELNKDESELANIRIYCYDLTRKRKGR